MASPFHRRGGDGSSLLGADCEESGRLRRVGLEVPESGLDRFEERDDRRCRVGFEGTVLGVVGGDGGGRRVHLL